VNFLIVALTLHRWDRPVICTEILATSGVITGRICFGHICVREVVRLVYCKRMHAAFTALESFYAIQ